jgi:hypothetical protein
MRSTRRLITTLAIAVLSGAITPTADVFAASAGAGLQQSEPPDPCLRYLLAVFRSRCEAQLKQGQPTPQLNPQPLPPGYQLNPQPLPPGRKAPT